MKRIGEIKVVKVAEKKTKFEAVLVKCPSCGANNWSQTARQHQELIDIGNYETTCFSCNQKIKVEKL